MELRRRCVQGFAEGVSMALVVSNLCKSLFAWFWHYRAAVGHGRHCFENKVGEA